MSRKRGGYRAKVHPIFIDLAELNRECEIKFAGMQRECERGLKQLGPKPDLKLRSEVVARFESQGKELLTQHYKKSVSIQRRYPKASFNKLAYHYFSYDPKTQDDMLGIVEYIHWERHGESIENTWNSVREGDVGALKQLQRTEEDFFRVANRKGPIKRFQGDVIHRQLLQLILCYETAPMTKEERTDCVDDYCACGKTHDPDALDKQYRRLKKQLQASADSRQTTTR